jgi:hypothetical protein
VSKAARNHLLSALALLFALALALALSGCTHSSKSASSGAAARDVGAGSASAAAGAYAPEEGVAAAQGTSAAAAQPAATTTLQQKDFVRTATIAVRVTNADAAANDVLAAAARVGGQIESDNRDADGETKVADLIVRLPPAGLDGLIASTVKLGKEQNRAVTGRDVTAAHADVDARVAALRTSVDRLRDFLSHSGSIGDLVKLEGDLSQREATLESTVAQQQALNDQIALSTLTVHLSEPPAATAVARRGHHAVGFAGAIVTGWHGFTATLNWLAALAGYVIPFLPLLLVLALIAAGVAALRRRRLRSGRSGSISEPTADEAAATP